MILQDNVNNLFFIQYIFFLSFFLLASFSGRYQYDSKAFLFALVNKPGWAPVRLSQTGQHSYRKGYSIYFFSSYGPTFGGHDINIKSDASIAILIATLAILTTHRAGTATAAPSPKHSWQELTHSHQMKLKPFTNQPS